MSYYRPTDGFVPAPSISTQLARTAVSPPPLPISSPLASQAKPPVKFQIGGEDIVSPNVTVAPINVGRPSNPPARQKAGNARRAQVVTDLRDIVGPKAVPYFYLPTDCAVNLGQPKKVCFQPQMAGADTCKVHTCRAVNVDGERCCNIVVDPRASLYCQGGYHAETERYGFVESALETRRMYDEMEKTTRMVEHLSDVQHFAERWPTVDSPPSASASMSSISSAGADSPPPRTPVNRGLLPIVEVAGESEGIEGWQRVYDLPPLFKPRSRSTSRDGLGIDVGERTRSSWPLMDSTNQLTSRRSA